MDKNHQLQVQEPKISPKKKKSFSDLSPRQKWLGCIVAVIFLTAFLFVLGLFRIRSAYNTSKQNSYDSFYQAAYDFAENQNHVSNYALISVEAAKEVSRLEVLSVSDSEFVIKNADGKDRTTSWLEVQGTGVFTVDLSAGEFIVDSERQCVLVRVPKPVLTECKVSGTGKQFWKRNDFLIFNGSIADGVQLSQDQRKEGLIKLEDAMKRNRNFYEAAQKAAESAVGALVQQWNPSVPNLQVAVEFIEGN